jgi:signal transduction histidine kinase/putative methionine-R-sulfoxide reductase with GAF domain
MLIWAFSGCIIPFQKKMLLHLPYISGAVTMAETLDEKKTLSQTRLLERRIRELSTLHDIARAVTSVLDREPVLNRIVEAAVYLTNGEEGFLMLVDETTGNLALCAGKGLGDKASRIMNIPVNDSIAGQVVTTGRPVRRGGFRRDEEYKVKTGYLVKSLVNVPIKWAGQVIGVLSVDHSVASMRSFSDHDVALLSSLADYAAIAIQNARLFEQASTKADELAKAMEEQTGQKPQASSREADRQALLKFAQELRARHGQAERGLENLRELAHGLRSHADKAEEATQNLEAWDEGVLGLLPEFEGIVMSGLPLGQPQALAPSQAGAEAEAGPGARPGPASVPGEELLRHLGEGTLIADPQGVIRQANQAAAQMLGKAVADLIGSELHQIVDDPRWERLVNSLQLALAMGSAGGSSPPASETVLYIGDHVLRARLVPTYENGAAVPTHILTFLHDVSSETEGWRARDETLAELSRRIRGPMTAIASYSDLLLGDTAELSSVLQHRYLERIRRGVERLESILNQLEDEPTASARRTTPVPAPPTGNIINQTVDAVQRELSLDGVNIKRDIGQNLPSVQVDAEYISRILTNLLAAAGQRASFGDSVDISTQVQLDGEEPRHLVVLIQTQGAPDQDIPSFEEDEDVRAALSLAEDVGGRIWTERKADGGTLITVLLPVAEPA